MKKENYAFLMESTSIEYLEERECNVKMVGDLLDAKGYGIAMRKSRYFQIKIIFHLFYNKFDIFQDSSYRQPLSEAVLKLQEQGKLTQMKNKWWKEKRGGGACAVSISITSISIISPFP